MERVIKILKELHPEVDFEMESELVDSGILDSLDIVSLVTELNGEFDVEIAAEDLLPENFNSVAAIFSLVKRLGGT